VATEGFELDHVPPVVVLAHMAEDPIQTGSVPEIVCGVGAETVTVWVAVNTQLPTVTEYDMTEVPTAIALTCPEVEPTVAIEGSELVHVPPVVVLVQTSDVPTHSGVVPVMVS